MFKVIDDRTFLESNTGRYEMIFGLYEMLIYVLYISINFSFCVYLTYYRSLATNTSLFWYLKHFICNLTCDYIHVNSVQKSFFIILILY